jgi:hypothetical protein
MAFRHCQRPAGGFSPGLASAATDYSGALNGRQRGLLPGQKPVRFKVNGFWLLFYVEYEKEN